jgi:DNA-binding transcriptional LysR family regulator
MSAIRRRVSISRFALGFVEGRIRNEAMDAREFRRDRIVAVVAPQHPLAKGLPLERPLYTLKLRGRHLSRSALAFPSGSGFRTGAPN